MEGGIGPSCRCGRGRGGDADDGVTGLPARFAFALLSAPFSALFSASFALLSENLCRSISAGLAAVAVVTASAFTSAAASAAETSASTSATSTSATSTSAVFTSVVASSSAAAAVIGKVRLAVLACYEIEHLSDRMSQSLIKRRGRLSMF